MNNQELRIALAKISDAARAESKASTAALRAGRYTEFDKNERPAMRDACSIDLGNGVSAHASVGGNSVRQHVRISWKIDGKRASAANAEKLILEGEGA